MNNENWNSADLAIIERKATEWAAEAGRKAADFFRRELAVEYKAEGRRSPVTEADRVIEDYLREEISRHFPEHRVLGEERPDLGSEEAEFAWVLDPVDGTTNFAAGLPLFAVSIGVLHRGTPVIGAVYVPSSILIEGGVLHARLGGGCFVGDHRLAAFGEAELHPSRPAVVPGAFQRQFVIGKPLQAKSIEVRTLGSVAFELAAVATGSLQFSLFRSPHIWDVAGGAVLVAEAGGVVLNWDRQGECWQPLSRFVPSRGRNGENGKLRDWQAPVLAGGSRVTRIIARHLKPRRGHGALRRIREWLGRA